MRIGTIALVVDGDDPGARWRPMTHSSLFARKGGRLRGSRQENKGSDPGPFEKEDRFRNHGRAGRDPKTFAIALRFKPYGAELCALARGLPQGECSMKRLAVGMLFGLLCSTAASAMMLVGDKAPDFTVQAAIAGKKFTFSLAEALKKGPVVLYFYPKSFTAGCTIEAHEFAEHADDFAALGASLIGVSADSIESQVEFS